MCAVLVSSLVSTSTKQTHNSPSPLSLSLSLCIAGGVCSSLLVHFIVGRGGGVGGFFIVKVSGCFETLTFLLLLHHDALPLGKGGSSK